MTTNRLAKSEARETRMSAMDWARLAREKGLLQHESAWLAEAKRRGEIPSYGDRID